MTRYTFHVAAICIMMWFGAVVCDPTKMGPFDVKISSTSSCGPKTGRGFITDPKIRKYNRTIFAVSATVNSTIDFDDSLDLLVEMAVHTGNGWKDNFLRLTFKKACSTAMSYAGNLFIMMLKNAGLKAACPVPKGFYSLKDLPLVVEIKGIPVFWYGKYKFRLSAIEKSHSVLMCIDAQVDVVPKSKH